MTVKINGKDTHTQASTLKELARQLDLPEKGIAVAVSNKMIPRSEWEHCTIEDGTSIIVIRATCGG